MSDRFILHTMWLTNYRTVCILKEKTGDKRVLEKYNLDEVSNKLGIPAERVLVIIRQFLANIDDYLNTVKMAVSAVDYGAIAKNAHKFKGAASNLRFEYLAETMRTIQLHGKNSDADDYAALLKNAEREIERLLALFDLEDVP